MGPSQSANALIKQLTDHYGLTMELFSSEADFFFEGAQRSHNLETLRHMASFADMVLFLTGEKGAGKSTLLQQFVRSDFEGLHVISLDCERLLKNANGKPDFVLQTCLKEMGVNDADGDSSALFSLLVKTCHRWMASHDQRTVIAFDNADKLPRKELLAYCGFCRALPPESALVLLFAGSTGLIQSTKQGSNLERDNWWQQIHLKPFTMADIADYLSGSLKACGATSELNLSELQMQQLAELGKGLPGRINKFFPSVILEPGSLKIKKAKAATNMPVLAMIGIAGLLVLSFLFVSYQHGLFAFEQKTVDENGTEGESVLLEEDQQRLARLALLDKALIEQGETLDNSNQVAENVTSENELVSPIPLAEEVAVLDESAELLLASGSDLGAEIESIEEPEEVESTLSLGSSKQAYSSNAESEQTLADASKQPAKAPSIQDSVVNTDVAEKKATSKESLSLTNSNKPNFRTKEWVASQSKDAYMPQILGSFSEETATKFIKKIGKQKFDIFYLQTEHKGQSWFVVFYGIFPAKTHAQDAVKNSPQIIKSQKPWIRRVSEVLASYPK